MAKTQIADVIVPEVFAPYVIQRTPELSAMWQSGIVTKVPTLDLNGLNGGTNINMPFWNDLTGNSEVLSDSGSLTPQKIDASQDMSVLNARGKAWSVNDLAKALSGDDPMGAIGDLVAAWWSRDFQTTLFNILKGAFAAANMSGLIHDISTLTGGSELIAAEPMIDALQLLGDHKDQVSTVAMHSAVVSYLAKLDLIETVKDSDGKTEIKIYMGKRIIEDDGCPVDTGVYTTYIFGPGAIGYGEGKPPVPVETDRDSLAGDDVLVNRRHFVLHPRGIKWKGTPAGAAPTNTELGTGTNWERVYDVKNIRLIAFKHKIG